MTTSILIDPVSRIEGHAKITIRTDDAGAVTDAVFHVTEFRGFEEFCKGRPLGEMPSLTARTCGICPVSHLMASSKAADAILSVTIPPAAAALRRLMNLGQIVQSHALSFFHLSAPDLLLGMDSDPAARNVFGLIAADVDLARKGIRLRQFGQDVIAALGGSKIHPAWAVPGGVRSSLSPQQVSDLAARVPEALETAQMALETFRGLLAGFQREAGSFGAFPSLFFGLIAPDGRWEHYDGRIRIVDAAGEIVADGLDPADYRSYIGERTEPDSYLKSPYYRPAADEAGDPSAGMYRVGPLARVNLCDRMGTPIADQALGEFRDRNGGVATSSFLYHEARLIEIIAALERIDRWLQDPIVTSSRIRADAGINAERGVGASEAPRGTLFHDYEVDRNGVITGVNLIIATGQNNLAMNRTVRQIAEEFITGPTIPEGVLNRVEAGIRAFDPCLSCSTHAVGAMPIHVVLEGAGGEVLDEVVRG